MAIGIYAEQMPELTPEELDAKSQPGLLDRAYLDAGVTAADRLVLSPDVWVAAKTDGYVTVPMGPDAPWEVNLPASGRLTPIVTEENPMSRADARRWREMGYEVDQLNRPVNPRAEQVTTREGFGMLTGVGKYWNIGPNFIGNTGIRIIVDGKVYYLMTASDRGHGEVWGLPGGHKDKNDRSVEKTGVRETIEETGMPQRLANKLTRRWLFKHFVHRDWPQANRGATMNAWQEGQSNFYASRRQRLNTVLGGLVLAPTDPDEGITRVEWVALEDILSEEEGAINVMGSHKEGIQAYEEYLKTQRQSWLGRILSGAALAAS